MPTSKDRTKKIIMDKAPNGDSLKMQADFGFDNASYDELTSALNTEFGTNYNVEDIKPLQTVQDVVTFVETHP
jgi:acyl carrier protein